MPPHGIGTACHPMACHGMPWSGIAIPCRPFLSIAFHCRPLPWPGIAATLPTLDVALLRHCGPLPSSADRYCHPLLTALPSIANGNGQQWMEETQRTKTEKVSMQTHLEYGLGKLMTRPPAYWEYPEFLLETSIRANCSAQTSAPQTTQASAGPSGNGGHRRGGPHHQVQRETKSTRNRHMHLCLHVVLACCLKDLLQTCPEICVCLLHSLRKLGPCRSPKNGMASHQSPNNGHGIQ